MATKTAEQIWKLYQNELGQPEEIYYHKDCLKEEAWTGWQGIREYGEDAIGNLYKRASVAESRKVGYIRYCDSCGEEI